MMNKFVRMFGALMLAFSVVNVVKAEPFTAQVFDETISLSELKAALEHDNVLETHHIDPNKSALLVLLGNSSFWEENNIKLTQPVAVMLRDNAYLLVATQTKESVCDAVNNRQNYTSLFASKSNGHCNLTYPILLFGGVTGDNIRANVINFIINIQALIK
ncbi:hypothetical protein [Actinobacillus porcinus]|uniref:hypothetical protein n=1 Tax=Actinobacillus porcinus TaxID=51048 RepID=UPI0023533042|nr:hypothetical protein [Actinobacillus porcinus]